LHAELNTYLQESEEDRQRAIMRALAKRLDRGDGSND
jgi:hypothetical protein